MLRTVQFSVDLSQYLAGHPHDLEQLPDRDQYQIVTVSEACRIVEACFQQGQGQRLGPVYSECVLGALGRGDVEETAPFAKLVVLRRAPAAKRRKQIQQGKLAPVAEPKRAPPAPPKERIKTWFEVLVVDEVGEPVGGIELDFAAGSASGRTPTDRSGKARVENADVHSGSVRLANVRAVLDLMEPRWSSPRTGTSPRGGNVVETVVAEPARKVALESEEPRTIVLRPAQPGYGIESVTFVGNHGLMKVNTKDWTAAGPSHPRPEWRSTGTETRPVSYTKGSKLAIDLEVVPKRPDGPVEDASVAGAAAFENMSLRGQGRVGRSSAVVSMQGGVLPNRVAALKGDIRWTITAQATSTRYDAGSSRGHTVFVTIDTPASVAGSREEGITERRMAAATRVIAGAGSNDPHRIVAHLMGLFRGYTLRPNPAVPSQFDHPTYFNSVGGAWPMADHLDKSGECQAIVRFVHAAIKQVGCPGKADLVVVWADPDVAGGTKGLEATSPPGGGLYNKTKVVNGRTWAACLVDTYPVEGKIYDIEQLNSSYMGLNNFEACLRFEHGGVKRYYGGGAGTYQSPDDVLLAFQALAWVSFGHRAATGNNGARVEKVVKRWRDASGNVL
jgi:hypothetical protein